MLRAIYFIIALFILSCKTTTYYITRHAEKAGTNMNTDPLLTAEGEKQALDLRDYLSGKNIRAIYSTNFSRTKATAQPTSSLFGVPVTIYNPSATGALIDTLKKVTKGNVLIVGHSNTVDDIANGLTGTNNMNDLADNEYGNLFIVKRKGTKYFFERIKLPQTTPR